MNIALVIAGGTGSRTGADWLELAQERQLPHNG